MRVGIALRKLNESIGEGADALSWAIRTVGARADRLVLASVKSAFGRFSGRKAGAHEQRVRAWAAEQRVGGGPIEVIGVHDVVRVVREAAGDTQYRDSAVLATLKALQEAGQLVS